LSFEAWVLFSILFFWQLPHFLAISWFCRQDYEKAGFVMLSSLSPDGKQIERQILLYSLALLPVSLLPTLVGLTGNFYFFGAFILGVSLILRVVRSYGKISQDARTIFRASLLYLSFLLLLMAVDKV